MSQATCKHGIPGGCDECWAFVYQSHFGSRGNEQFSQASPVPTKQEAKESELTRCSAETSTDQSTGDVR